MPVTRLEQPLPRRATLDQPAHVLQVQAVHGPMTVRRNGDLGCVLPFVPFHVAVQKTHVGAAGMPFTRQMQPAVSVQLQEVAAQFLLRAGRRTGQAEDARVNRLRLPETRSSGCTSPSPAGDRAREKSPQSAAGQNHARRP